MITRIFGLLDCGAPGAGVAPVTAAADGICRAGGVVEKIEGAAAGAVAGAGPETLGAAAGIAAVVAAGAASGAEVSAPAICFVGSEEWRQAGAVSENTVTDRIHKK
jgi:hypothetical protein